MMSRCKRWAAAAAALALAACLHAGALAQAEPKVGAGGAVLMEAGTKTVLYASNAHVRLPMASTTKIMTALLALEQGNPDELVCIPDEALGVEGSSIYLKLGEVMSLRDLLYGLMLSSGNDAAVAIAATLGGSVEGFARMMNQRARELGALNTNFVNPNGLHDQEHYTTAYDLALISAHAMGNPAFAELVSAQYHKATTGDTARTFKNKNKILWQYEGGNGIKTGYTQASGKCLAFSAARGNMQLVGIVLNCPGMFPDSMALLNYGFAAYEMRTLVAAGDFVTRAHVRRGQKTLLDLVAQQDIIVPVRTGQAPSCKLQVRLNFDALTAPLSKGTPVGTLEAWDGTSLLASAPLAAAEDVAATDMGYYLGRIARSMLSQ